MNNRKIPVRLRLGVMAVAALMLLGMAACAAPDDDRIPPVLDQLPIPAPSEGVADEPEAGNAAVAPVDEANKIWNIKDFGATGDGETDDYPAIRAAIDTVAEAGGGSIFFPSGTYVVPPTLYVAMAGEAPIRLFSDPSAGAVLAFKNKSGPNMVIAHPYFTMENMGVSQSATTDSSAIVLRSDYATLKGVTAYMCNGNTSPAIVVYGSYNTLKSVGVSGGSDTTYIISFSKMAGIRAIGNVLEDCHYGGGAPKCVLVTSEDANGVQEELTIRRNVFLVTNCDQIEVQAAKNMRIIDNMLDAAGTCVFLNPQKQGIDGIQMTNNYCGASRGGLISAAGEGGTIKNVVVSANYFWAANPIMIPEFEHVGFTLTDNYFVTTGGASVSIKNADGAYFEGNVVVLIGGTHGLVLQSVDENTVIRHNAWGDGVNVPEWNDRFAALN